jgi:hypothetical protein
MNPKQCRREGGWEPVQITGDRQAGRGSGARGPTMLHIFFFCLQYHYLSTVQINPFLDQAQVALQLTVSLSDLM